METSLIDEVAKQIVEKQILLNWKFYALIVLLQIPVIYFRTLFEKYAGKRGETLATKADLNEILRQLQKTTQTAENIKVAVAHKDWTVKEFKTLRRIKLEELISCIYEIQTMSEDLLKSALFNIEFGNFDPLTNKMLLLTGLYFPELKEEIRAFRLERIEAHKWFIDLKKRAIPLSPLSPEFDALVAETSARSRQVVLDLYDKQTRVEAKARTIMEGILEYEDTEQQA